MRLFLLGVNIADDMDICDLVSLGDFVPVDEKQVLVPYMSPSPWKNRPISLDMRLIHFNVSVTFSRFWYSWTFPVSGQMTAFSIPGCKVRLTFAWSINDQYSPAGRTEGAELLCEDVGVLIVATWFTMSSCPWIQCSRVLYLYTCVTLGVSVDFWCASVGIGYVSLGMILGAYLGVCIGARPGWNDMLYFGSTLRGGAGDDYGFAFGVFTL